MPPLLLATKLYIPPPRPDGVARPHLLGRLDAGLARPLTVVSAPAGFGKTTLLGAWAAAGSRPVAWLTLDAGDSDPGTFLSYLVAALRTLLPALGANVLPLLGAPQPPPVTTILTALLNELAAAPELTLILDDYHALDSPEVDAALAFLVDHLPRPLHLVIATREDPPLPLARLRAGGRLHELRAADLRFTAAEAAAFLNGAMGLRLDADEVAALEARTEGWIAGLQLAGLSLQGRADPTGAIRSFSGSHHFVLDYLVEEVLQRQPPAIQTFLLRTSILERLCGPLCDAVVHGDSLSGSLPAGAPSGQEMLRFLERANLFLTPLDDERRWYRYHPLFRDLLRQRLLQSPAADDPQGGGASTVAACHMRASRWLEANGLEVEALHHAAAGGDIDAAARLVEGKEMPLHFRGAVAPVLHWLASLPPAVLQARPGLNVIYASALLYAGRLAGVEEKLHAAEAGLAAAGGAEGPGDGDEVRNLIGHIAAVRATLAVTEHAAEEIVAQAQRALHYLPPSNLPVRTAMTWTLGYAHQLRGERAAARAAYREALESSQAIGHFIITVMTTLGLGLIEEGDNQLDAAAASFARVLRLVGEPAPPLACAAHLGLARICYERDDLAAAQEHARQAIPLARQIETTDRLAACLLLVARLQLAEDDVDAAAVTVAEAAEIVRRRGFAQRAPDVAAIQTLVLLCRGDLPAAAAAAQAHPLSQARVYLAQGDASAALALLDPLYAEAEAKGWADERLQVLVLKALAHQAQGAEEDALRLLHEALIVAQPGGFVRLFADEGAAMAQLLRTAARRGIMPDYTAALLAALAAHGQSRPALDNPPDAPASDALTEPLSEREREVLLLIAAGLSNREIGERLFLALDTVKGHNRRIFAKLQVARRTEAIAKARALHLLPSDLL